MYKLIGIICFLFSQSEIQHDEASTFINFSKGSDSSLINISKEIVDEKTVFIFHYESRTERFISEISPVKIPFKSINKLTFKTPNELRTTEKEAISDNLKTGEKEGKLKIILSVNELFPKIYMTEKVSEAYCLKYKVIWVS